MIRRVRPPQNRVPIMNLSVLKKLSTEALFQLQEGVKQEIESRIDYSIEVGRYATFVDSRKGVNRRVRITKINTKTATVVETSDSANPGLEWRVSFDFLNVEGVQRKNPITTSKVEAPKKMVTNTKNAW